MSSHSLLQGVYRGEGHQYPLDPQMYIQKAVCKKEDRPFRSKVGMALDVVDNFSPSAKTDTHLLVDSWYFSKRTWKAMKCRGWELT